MELNYDVLYKNRVVGNAYMTRSGLYWLIRCRCTLPVENIYRLHVSSESATIRLGVMCPKEGGFALETKLPCKRITQGTLRFFLTDGTAREERILIENGKTFAKLDQLDCCRFCREEERAYLVLTAEK